MIKIKFLFLFSIITFKSFAQDDYIKLPNAKTHNPTFIYNNDIIGSEYAMKAFKISKEEIQKLVEEVYVLKDRQNRGLNNYYNLTEHGLLFLELKKEAPIIPSKTQAELNTFFGLNELSDIYVDGYLVESKDYKICLIEISDIEIVYPKNDNKLKNRVLNIWTLQKDKRYRTDIK